MTQLIEHLAVVKARYTIYQINISPVDSAVGFVNTYLQGTQNIICLILVTNTGDIFLSGVPNVLQKTSLQTFNSLYEENAYKHVHKTKSNKILKTNLKVI